MLIFCLPRWCVNGCLEWNKIIIIYFKNRFLNSYKKKHAIKCYFALMLQQPNHFQLLGVMQFQIKDKNWESDTSSLNDKIVLILQKKSTVMGNSNPLSKPKVYRWRNPRFIIKYRLIFYIALIMELKHKI